MDTRTMRVIGAWATLGAVLNFGLAWVMWGERGVRTRAQLASWMGLPAPPPTSASRPITNVPPSTS